jgi:hypothetical protein
MGIGYENWHVECIDHAWVWAVDNIQLDLQGIGRRSLDLFQDRGRWRVLKFFNKLLFATLLGKFLDQLGKC